MQLSSISSYISCCESLNVNLNSGKVTGTNVRLSTTSKSLGIKSNLPEGIVNISLFTLVTSHSISGIREVTPANRSPDPYNNLNK